MLTTDTTVCTTISFETTEHRAVLDVRTFRVGVWVREADQGWVLAGTGYWADGTITDCPARLGDELYSFLEEGLEEAVQEALPYPDQTYRAAVWTSADGESQVCLTSREQAALDDGALLCAASSEADRVGLERHDGDISVFAWTE